MLDIAEWLLETRDIRVYQAAVTAKYSDAAPDYEQLLHVDYANHTLVVPRTDVGYQHLTTFIYLTDVTPSTGATRIVSREHTTGIPIERTYLHLEEYADLYALEEPASGPAGSVLVYRPDVFHRGVPLSTPRRGAVLASGRLQTGRYRMDRLPRLPGSRRGHGVAPFHASRRLASTHRTRLPRTRRPLLDRRNTRRRRRALPIPRHDPLEPRQSR